MVPALEGCEKVILRLHGIKVHAGVRKRSLPRENEDRLCLFDPRGLDQTTHGFLERRAPLPPVDQRAGQHIRVVAHSIACVLTGA